LYDGGKRERASTTANDVPRLIRLQEGEPIANMALCLQLNTLTEQEMHSPIKSVRASAHNRLVKSLLNINFNKMMGDLMMHDPLSWHCTARHTQQLWVINQKQLMDMDTDTVIPQSERPPSPRTRRPEYQHDGGDANHTVQRAERPMQIVVNTMSWPPVRHIHTTMQADAPPPPYTVKDENTPKRQCVHRSPRRNKPICSR
jgi:hypothetical protein